MTQSKYPLKAAAEELASKGRYGDTRLVHINEAELQGIASLAPGGKLTINPDTGQPEAFLPFLAPILGAVAGKAFLPLIATKLGGAALGSMVTPALAGALGSGLATGLAENSLEKGLLAGVTGFGLGSAMGAAGSGAASTAAAEVGKSAAKEGVKRAGESAMQELLGGAAEGAMQGFPQAGLDAFGQSMAQSAPSWSDVLQSGLSDIGNMGSNLGAIGSAMMQPGPMLATSYGLGSLANLRAMDARRDSYNNRIRPSVEQGRRFKNDMNASLREAGSRYGFEAGGITSVNPAQYQSMREGAVRFATGGSTEVLQGSPGQRQAALRGPEVLTPPEGYRPGVDPEFMYFGTAAGPNMPAAPTQSVNPFAEVPADVLNRYRQVARDLGNFHTQQDLSSRNRRNRQQYLPEFTRLRTQYPGLSSLDTEFDIDREFQMSGADPVTSNLPGAIGGGIASIPTGINFSQALPPLGQFQQQQGVDPEAFYRNIVGSGIPGSTPFMDPRSPRMMAEGGMTEAGMADPLIEQTVQAILGQIQNGDEVIQMFVERHGPEAFAQLRAEVLQNVVPGAQTEGQMKGPGGGMDDQLPGMIGSSQPVALSTDEFVVPADVVSALGDGSSDAGAEVLYEMMDSVRRYKGGKTEQPPKMSPEMLEQIKLGRP